jgi:DNA polymerase III alpha subunit (gram-positive type)
MDMIFYVLDTETSGLSTDKNEVFQISIIRADNKNILNKFIKCEHPETASPQALQVTGATLEDLVKGEPKESVVDFCNDFFSKDEGTAENRCVIAHNASFDRRFCHALWAKCNKVFPANLWLDTIPYTKEYARIKSLNEKSFTLDNALRMLEIKKIAGQAHTADNDAKNTFLAWEKLKKSGVSQLPFIKRVEHIL